MITADHNGIVRGKFTLPENIPAGIKSVEFIGERGSRGISQFIGRGTINIEERRRVRVLQKYDPLAQTFTLLSEARHIAGVGIYFIDKGTKSVTVQIRETANGFPTGVVLIEKRLEANEIQAQGETQVNFDTPIFLGSLQEYAIVILTDDDKHSLAIAEVGQYDKHTKRYVTEQSYAVGVLLSSSNASTWTPHNNADLTFKLYAARFTANTQTVNLAQINVTNASDLYLNADIERTGVETDVLFNMTEQGEEQVQSYRLQDKQAVRLTKRTTGNLTSTATLTGSAKRSPVLYPGIIAVAGNLQTSATYISRSIPCGKGKATVILEVNVPTNSSIQVEIEVNGRYQVCSPTNGELLGDGWVRNEYSQKTSNGDSVRCRITLTGRIDARPRARMLRMITT
ncbi:hypothetical protein [Histophilus somni]|uniref:hypothetical protein n=1 Tax=Histophilus somni TaxID=731 RepID=UPI00201E7611|nr:hypothetical protein [Histophilus somni]